MHTKVRVLAIALLMGIAWPTTPAAAQRRVPGDPVALRTHRPNTGLFGPRTRKEHPNKVDRLGAEEEVMVQADASGSTPAGTHNAPLRDHGTALRGEGIPSVPAPEALRTLRAVIAVGPVESNTPQFISEMEDAASVLREAGVHVSTFYHPTAAWADVARAAQGADIFLYSGHGVRHDRHARLVGGLALSDGIVGPEPTAEGLGLRDGALVLFAHACYTAGSASGDRINLKEAQRRVACYAAPFMQHGVDAYFAINLCDAMAVVLRRFLQGEPLDIVGFPSPPSTRPLQLPGLITDKEVMVGGVVDELPGRNVATNAYDVAFVGPSHYTIHQLLDRR
jgi:hypothetical protein